ncbi:GNAT family N-acetyltransferase [Tuberibacillus sp. Marseille-P3662]|uniref:GNAT family N-acetyltransferase n=1 Tax=Tuberibacillus sp. Marseille-P3662 TaxID=1965358 RepID=UPI000A1CA34D|nr:GNAT family N-acetyltransferase [Tuberibacillus sp. Marseille-P3662]
MNIQIQSMDKRSAVRISQWHYEDPYSLYNVGEDAVDEFLENDYYAVFDLQEGLIGFFCLGRVAQVPGGYECHAYENRMDVIDIGLGMRPDMTGQGFGCEFIHHCLIQAKDMYPQVKVFRLTVATFNLRAIKVYERLGFQAGMHFVNPIGLEFMTMLKKAE